MRYEVEQLTGESEIRSTFDNIAEAREEFVRCVRALPPESSVALHDLKTSTTIMHCTTEARN